MPEEHAAQVELLVETLGKAQALDETQVDDILRTFGAAEIARQVENQGWGGLASMTSVKVASTGPSTPTTATPGPTGKPPPPKPRSA
jgi:hypothetical protein